MQHLHETDHLGLGPWRQSRRNQGLTLLTYLLAMALVVQYALTTERGSWIITQLPQYFAVVSQQHHTATHYIQESQPRETEAVLRWPRSTCLLANTMQTLSSQIYDLYRRTPS